MTLAEAVAGCFCSAEWSQGAGRGVASGGRGRAWAGFEAGQDEGGQGAGRAQRRQVQRLRPPPFGGSGGGGVVAA